MKINTSHITTAGYKEAKIPEATNQKSFFWVVYKSLQEFCGKKEHRRPRPTLRRKLTPAPGHVANTPQQFSFANAHKQLHGVFVEPILISNYISYSCVSKFYVVYFVL